MDKSTTITSGMSIAALVDELGAQVLIPDAYGESEGKDLADIYLYSAHINAQKVQPHGLFMAVPGTRVHGAHYAEQSQGAAILTDGQGSEIIKNQGLQVPVIVVEDCRQYLGKAAAAIYGHPAQKMTVIGITGTSGKTTTSYLIEQALLEEHKVGLIGTTGTRINGRPVPSSLTTPEAPLLQELFAHMYAEGVTHVVMEVSSHAIALERIQDIEFDVVAFTNLSQDHLDFHPSMSDYFETKKRLFTDYQATHAVIMVEDEWGVRLAQALEEEKPESLRTMTTIGTTSGVSLPSFSGDGAAAEKTEATGLAGELEIQHWQIKENRVYSNGYQDFKLKSSDRDVHVKIGLIGAFNVFNASTAVACLTAVGADSAKSIAALERVQVPGRMQIVNSDEDPITVVVDYAHKPGAVAAVMEAAKEHLARLGRGRVAILLGAGGDRDHSKRPLMGREAASVADALFITDDNPRSEDPAQIRAEILAGASELEGSECEIYTIAGRGAAIEEAIDWCQLGDLLIIAGKGHETGQIIGDIVHDFSDITVAQEILLQRRQSSAWQDTEI